MSDDQPVRPPPRIIQVPPPRAPSLGAQTMLAGVLTLLVLPLMDLGGFSPYAGAVTLCLGAAAIVTTWRGRREFNQARRTWLERHSAWDADLVAAHLEHCWHSIPLPPDSALIQAALRRMDSTEPAGGVLACFGVFHLPEPAVYRFEPLILKPGRAMPGRSTLLPALTLLSVALWFWLALPFVVIGPTAGGLVMGAAIAPTLGFVWRRLLRPTYVRAAPGIVQVMQYAPWRSKPRIRSYPIDSGTLCVLTQTLTGATLTLSRGDDTDTVAIDPARASSELIERLLHALVSTAPTPPLSTEELVG